MMDAVQRSRPDVENIHSDKTYRRNDVLQTHLRSYYTGGDMAFNTIRILEHAKEETWAACPGGKVPVVVLSALAPCPL